MWHDQGCEAKVGEEMNEEEFEKVLDRIFPENKNMRQARTSLYRRAAFVAMECFMHKMEGEDVNALRAELLHVDKHGVFSWTLKS